MTNIQNILIIRHGALGDVCQAFEAFASIRQAFAHAHITLLTSSPYQALAVSTPWFDAIAIDDRPPITHWRHWRNIRALLHKMDLVFDLQNSGRTSRYRTLAPRTILWSGQQKRASLPHHNPQARQMHTLCRQRDQLRSANVPLQPRTIPTFLKDEGPFLTEPYVVLVPGAAPHRPAKRWPLTYFADLAHTIAAWGYVPLIVGSATDAPLAAHICHHVPTARDFTGKTTLPALAGLLHRALLCCGNDTGPLHMAAMMDCPTLTLFSAESDPRRCAPHGLTVGQNRVMQADTLAHIQPERVMTLLHDWGLPLMQARRAHYAKK
ncbi:glycosyltransferase family 9 protein [Bombella pollinis]|uniref:Glycosyltransferase family 9 protein n=1 Tax=Bombella pollinis TaxID=2967337 RepID=A0ABT3WQT4_9PROT|nr:glycosyltransferase family 9 protein [Bombella pollinis]MCX5620072.1 glycosyltransferase family 9 protein [Bombella pollinis]